MARLYASFLWLALSLFVKSATSDIQCLVSRAGFGLVSEHCPAHTVGCRIRIQRNAVTFYDFLDSNQFVCMLKGEFGEQQGSGCVRKRSGNIRCWCFGRSNCNTAENSKLLYEAFVSGNEQKLLEAIRQVDFADLAEQPVMKNNDGTEETGTGTTTTKTITISHTNFASAQSLSSKKLPSTTSTKTVNSLFHRAHKEQKISPAIAIKSITPSKWQSSSSSSLAPSSLAPSAASPAAPMPSPNSSSSKLLPLHNSTVQSEYDRRNRVHVIHVSSRDQYEPVFGSAALRRIMAQERDRLKAESEDISAEIQDDYDEEDEGGEETEDLPSSSSQSSAAVLEGTDQPDDDGAQISRRVAQRSELAKPKASRIEQRERSSSSASNERLENALGDDSFYAPASSSYRQSFAVVNALFNLALLALFLAMIEQ
ncbi:hypothetical protein niasHS_001060 [Heterodera schachtii]|uniref:Uncharacterized protein n=1 Tax=Heterodera schachtii TaxID=97005 RepID=A0ABD2K893_HETSC